MFTGIVEELGTVVSITPVADGARVVIAATTVLTDAELGDSIAVNGCCLTVVEATRTNSGMRHVVECSPETLAKSTLGKWQIGSRMNLERAARLGEEIGGHLVAGHVDGVGDLTVTYAR